MIDDQKVIDAVPSNLEQILEEEYIIPIYQREYSWNKDNIYKLINSILSNREIYLGNILIERGKEKLRIIDGQQRITTLLLILYYLDSDKYNKEEIKKKIEVESENENNKLKELFSIKQEKIIENIEKQFCIKEKQRKQKEDELKRENIYKLNFYYIAKFLERLKNEDFKFKEKIINSILTKIKFVKITIEGNKLNTTEIFDEINTTGKPLECKDKFKVRLYNMYIDKEKNIGKKIDKIYSDINIEEKAIIELESKKKEELFSRYWEEDSKRKIYNYIEIDSERYDTDYFLRLYQFFLVTKKRGKNKNYTRQLLEMHYTSFYDGIFDIIFETKLDEKVDLELRNDKSENIQIETNEDVEYESILENRQKFKTFIEEHKNIEEIINIEDIQDIFDTLKSFKKFVMNKDTWENNIDAYFSYKLFKNYNRYNWIYRYLPVLYYYMFKEVRKRDLESFKANFAKFIEALNKLCAIYSICMSKQVNECKEILTFETNNLLKASNIEEYTNNFEKNIEEKVHKLSDLLDFVLSSNITESYHRKNIICLILAKEKEEKNYEAIDKLFSVKFDIEHIYACAQNGKTNKLKEEELNGIGNLMILESSFNQSIHDNIISEKIESYNKSTFNVANTFKDTFTKNEDFIKQIDDRSEENKKIIKNYFNIN